MSHLSAIIRDMNAVNDEDDGVARQLATPYDPAIKAKPLPKWQSWTRSAIRSEQLCWEAREQNDRDGERDWGIVAITCVAHADEQLRVLWRAEKLLTKEQMPDAYRYAIDATEEQLKVWSVALGSTDFDEGSTRYQRAQAYHSPERTELAEKHPSKETHMDYDSVRYSAEKTTEAVALLMGILESATGQPKEAFAEWAKANRSEFEGIKAMSSSRE